MVEIFVNRLEIANPSALIVDVIRFLDTPPRSRNELMAAFMRRIGICEERGSGMMRQETRNKLTDYWKKHNFNSKLSLIQTNI